MKVVAAHRRQKFAALCIAICAAALLSFTATWFSLFTEFENTTWDTRLGYLAPRTKADPRIRIIMIDQSSIDHFAREEKIFWPWPRALYAPVLKFLETCLPSSMAKDATTGRRHASAQRDWLRLSSPKALEEEVR
ncbi:MAG: CHASE2 domain-containing protein [Proteobacteria bacterium]|nr:CHASE2 domain-containing protein [Pseudomonadota bacterium]